MTPRTAQMTLTSRAAGTRDYSDLTGCRFGRLTVKCRAPSVGGRSKWLCVCDCGNTNTTSRQCLNSGGTKSCGCLQREKASVPREGLKTHGMSESSEYKIWGGIKKRCFNKKSKAFKNYGGRGITICERWKDSFEEFLNDVGLRPSKAHSLDRHPNNDGNYEPGNVRWATRAEQASNTRVNVRFDGKTIKEWSVELGLSYSTVWQRCDVWGHPARKEAK